MTKAILAALTALTVTGAAQPALAFNLLGTVGRVLDSNVSDPRDKPEVQAEQDFYDRAAREEGEHTNQAADDEQDFYDDQSRAERDYYDSFNR